MTYFLTLLGVAVCAVSGTLEARRKHMDIFGAIVIALVTALGGGTLRDVLLQHGPVFWIADPNPLWIALVAGIITFVAASSPRQPFLKFLLIVDAGGLALFTIAGMQKSCAAGVSPLIALVMGVITGVAGGIGRDILCNEIPLILRRDIYATAAIAGGVVYLVLGHTVLQTSVVSIIAIAIIFLIRLAALSGKLALPQVLQPSPDSSDS